MESIIVYPETKEQLAAVKAVMKAMKIVFEQKNEIYPDHVVSGVKRSLQQVAEGQVKPYTGIKDLLKRP